MKSIQFAEFQGPLSVVELGMPEVEVDGVVVKVEATGLPNITKTRLSRDLNA
jgi:D-arabinose 1-dehydrogenase-like Zn-dependent alcohol dehydrogenase